MQCIWSSPKWGSWEALGKCCCGSAARRSNLPALVLDAPGADVVWKLPVYNTIWHMLRNPMYAGAYAFGKTEARTKVIDGRARKSEGHFKPFDDMDGLDSRSPSRLHFLGAVRT